MGAGPRRLDHMLTHQCLDHVSLHRNVYHPPPLCYLNLKPDFQHFLELHSVSCHDSHVTGPGSLSDASASLGQLAVHVAGRLFECQVPSLSVHTHGTCTLHSGAYTYTYYNCLIYSAAHDHPICQGERKLYPFLCQLQLRLS